jgi:hypothetical protein
MNRLWWELLGLKPLYPWEDWSRGEKIAWIAALAFTFGGLGLLRTLKNQFCDRNGDPQVPASFVGRSAADSAVRARIRLAFLTQRRDLEIREREQRERFEALLNLILRCAIPDRPQR